jgi:hypothetical protein
MIVPGEYKYRGTAVWVRDEVNDTNDIKKNANTLGVNNIIYS